MLPSGARLKREITRSEIETLWVIFLISPPWGSGASGGSIYCKKKAATRD